MQLVDTAQHQQRLREVDHANNHLRADRFDFRGWTFVIAPPRSNQDSWLTNDRTQLGEPVGRLDFDGRVHLIYRQPANEQNPETRAPRLTDVLTRRELEIVLLIAEGCCDKEIGRSLGISSYTVREHIRRAAAKLGVSRRAAIVSVVIRALSGSPRVSESRSAELLEQAE
jgi:DNA-binding CsgD family transcriptional regulator